MGNPSEEKNTFFLLQKRAPKKVEDSGENAGFGGHIPPAVQPWDFSMVWWLVVGRFLLLMDKNPIYRS